MKLLVIGGSQFVGRHLVETALARGDAVTVFNRGRTAAAPAGVEQRIGDRRGDLAALAHGRWDAVVDTCGYLPAEVARMAETLRGRVGRYLFVSSVSVYADFRMPNDERSPLGRIDDPDTEVVDGRTYGPLKALCEAAIRGRFDGPVLVVRPGLVVGPHDPTGRFGYWPARIARARDGEPVLAPGRPQDPVQCIDARDLAGFLLELLQAGRDGVVNAASEPGALTMGAVLDACARVAGNAPRFVWTDAATLARLGVAPWTELPLWLPPAGEFAAFPRTDTASAGAWGLRCRPIERTVADTLAWHRALPVEAQAITTAGLAPERERQLLASIEGP